ncbi:uncharacterized protein H6S33_007976 [Morchella sextelata]|uniref:uncharacterized protein n=1 Tax=Morchella sextelata TaxID=1174677 RepID=UPI001D053C57|nr:uncharacterized protein H6S33_007976 [Morchella sextelata]KAH0602972.1 hypothetical protein H6S33_007976 [Morchella sextelata]
MSPLIPVQPLFSSRTQMSPHAVAIHPGVTREEYVDSLIRRHSVLRTEYITLKERYRRLAQDHANALNPGRNPTVKVFRAAPLINGLAQWLESFASDLEALLDAVNVAEARAFEKFTELMKVDKLLQDLGVPVADD